MDEATDTAARNSAGPGPWVRFPPWRRQRDQRHEQRRQHSRPARRVVEIGGYHVLTDPPRRDLTALVEVVALVADVPRATINLITETQQHSIATKGVDASICRREDSMCTVSIEETEPVVVADASRDPRFRDNPFVRGDLGNIRFYAAHQLVTPSGTTIGTLCVYDDTPRTLTRAQRDSLASLAERVVDLLELELRTRALTASMSELQEARAELERSNQNLAAFAGQVSHDLSNPLTAVSMAVRMLDEQLGDQPQQDPEVGWLLRRATRGAERMQALIADLLSFARLGGQLARVDVGLDALLRDVCEDLAPALADADLTVRPLPTVVGDPVQLRAVLQNLVANAAKFTRPGERAAICVGSHRAGDFWRIDVEDRGPGIPPDRREAVFEPLVRAADDQPGSGIGLATVRRIVQAHGGSAGLDDAPAGGTIAWFTLPA